MAIVHDQGIVLRTYDFGEADKVVVLLSPNSGKLRTVAKGIRKTKSRFGGRLEPFCHVDLTMYEGRNLDTITAVSTIDTFSHMRSDLGSVLTASTMAEVVDLVATEGEPSTGLFLLLRRGLAALDSGVGGPDLVAAFLLRLARIVGVEPSLDSCASCGRPEAVKFSISGGGAVCRSCNPPGAVRLREGVLDHLRTLAEAPFDNLDLDHPMGEESMGLVRRFLEYHLEHRLSSLAVLDA